MSIQPPIRVLCTRYAGRVRISSNGELRMLEPPGKHGEPAPVPPGEYFGHVALDLVAPQHDVRGSEALRLLRETLFEADAPAVEWLFAPAVGLDGRRPIELLGTAVGQAQVCHLIRTIDHGLL